MPETQKYEVTFVVRKEDGTIDHKWTARYFGENFADVEFKAYATLSENRDNGSKIERIELW